MVSLLTIDGPYSPNIWKQPLSLLLDSFCYSLKTESKLAILSPKYQIIKNESDEQVSDVKYHMLENI